MLRVVRGLGLGTVRHAMEARLADDIVAGRGGEWLWLVPTARWAQAISGRAMRASGLGASIAPHAMSLDSLAHRCGKAISPPLDRGSLQLLIADVIERDGQAARSFVNGRGAARTGAVNQLARAFDELMNLGDALPPGEGDVGREAMRVLREVQRRIGEHGMLSPGTHGRLQRQAITPRRLSEEFGGVQVAVIDGFDDFDPLLRHTLGALCAWMEEGGDVILLVDDDPDRPGLCAHMREAMDEILAEAEDTPIACGPVATPLADAFGGSRRDDGEETPRPGGNVQLQPCRTPHDEVVWIARRIKRFAQENPRVPLSRIAVVFAQPSAVLPTLREVFHAWGIPHTIAEPAGIGDSLATSPLAQSALAAWRVAAGDFQRRDLAALLRHRLWRGVYRLDSASVESEARELRMNRGRDLWQAKVSEALEITVAMEAHRAEEEDGDQDAGLLRERRLVRLRRFNRALERLSQDLDPLMRRGTLGEALRALWDLLVRRRVVERLIRLTGGDDPSAMTAALRSAAAFEKTVSGIEESEWIAPRSLSPEDAMRLASALFASTPLEGTVPGTEAVQVFGQSQGRYQLGGRDWALIFVGGMIEGAWPRAQRTPALGMPTPLTEAPEVDLARQRHALYQILRIDPGQVILTWPVTSGDSPQNPSPLLEEVAALLGIEIPKSGAWKIEDVASTEECLAPHELQWTAAAALDDAPEEAAEGLLASGGQALDAVRVGYPIVRARRAPDGWSHWEGRLSDEDLIRLWSERCCHHIWSASELEALSHCAWRTMMERVLRLTPPPESEAAMHRMERGTLIHAILCEGLRRWRAETGRARAEILPDEVDRASALLAEVAEIRLGSRPEGALMWQIERELLLGAEGREGLLRAFVEREAESDSPLAPRHLEWRFGWREGERAPQGTEGDAPALTLGESIRIRGVIDRIDCDEAESMWGIVDYKTGAAKFGARDVMEGRHLQLPLYVLAVADALAGDPGRVVSASVHSVGRIRDVGTKPLYVLRGGGSGSRGGKPAEEIALILEAARWHTEAIVERTGAGDFLWTTRPFGEACERCAWKHACRRDEQKVAAVGGPEPFAADEGDKA